MERMATFHDYYRPRPSAAQNLPLYFLRRLFPRKLGPGEQYNHDPVTKDARICGTTASLCGIEKGLEERDDVQIDLGVRRDLMMHAAMMCMAGFPMLSSGDEIGQLNGWGYHDDPDLREDSRNLHRTPFNWDNAALRTESGTVQRRLWDGLRQLERIRASEATFGLGTWATTWDTANDHVLGIVRRAEKEILVCLFNFSNSEQEVWMDAVEGTFIDLIAGEITSPAHCILLPYQYSLYRMKY